MQLNYRRLFIGLPLSPALKKRLRREMERWPEEATLPTRETNLHVTVFYLGFILEDDIYDISQKIAAVTEGMPSFDLAFSRIEGIESEEDPKMIWLSGEPSDELRVLRQELERVFTNFTHDKKAFRPHVTLAKLKRARWAALPKKPIIQKDVNFVEPVEEVVLYESLIIDGKRTYEPIDTFPLS